MPVKSEMKVRDLVVLVKYAQGAVVFDSYYSMLKFFKPPERKVFLSQIVELIGHFIISDSVADLVIKESALSYTCSACLILKEGINETQLQKIIELPDDELKSSFKLLLTLFSSGYQEGFKKRKNTPEEFWYWDYFEVEIVYKFVQLDYNKTVLLNDVLRPYP
jgi:Family of unknown function (DUF5958)